jgi:hypothetical protein
MIAFIGLLLAIDVDLGRSQRESLRYASHVVPATVRDILRPCHDTVDSPIVDLKAWMTFI